MIDPAAEDLTTLRKATCSGLKDTLSARAHGLWFDVVDEVGPCTRVFSRAAGTTVLSGG